MRKVLLATTALVALNVSAASADISIGGEAVFEVYSPASGAQTYTTDGSIVITASNTLDNGMTVSAVQDMKFEGSSSVNDSYIELKGDFGTVRMGTTDGALDRNDGNLAANMDLETTGAGTGNLSATAIGGDSANISFFAPSMSGLSLYGELEADGAGSGVGANYTIGGISIMAQAAQEVATTSGVTDANALGIKFSAAGFTVQAGATTKDANSAAAKVKANDVGVSYSIDGIKVVATSARGKQGTRTDKYDNIGVSYSIAPGVTAMIETGEGRVNGTTTDATWAAISVKF